MRSEKRYSVFFDNNDMIFDEVAHIQRSVLYFHSNVALCRVVVVWQVILVCLAIMIGLCFIRELSVDGSY